MKLTQLNLAIASLGAAAEADPGETVICPRPGWVAIDRGGLDRARERLYHDFAWRDIKVRSKQTAIGVAWAVLQPLFTLLISSVVFGRFARIPSVEVRKSVCYAAVGEHGRAARPARENAWRRRGIERRGLPEGRRMPPDTEDQYNRLGVYGWSRLYTRDRREALRYGLRMIQIFPRRMEVWWLLRAALLSPQGS